MAENLYNTRILRLAASSASAARLDSPQGSATRVSPVCGSKVTADIDLDSAGRVAGFGQDIRACALGQAAAALVAAEIIGRPAAELGVARDQLATWLAGDSAIAPDWPGMDVFLPARPHRARHASILLSLDAAIAAAAEAAINNAAEAATALTPARAVPQPAA